MQLKLAKRNVSVSEQSFDFTSLDLSARLVVPEISFCLNEQRHSDAPAVENQAAVEHNNYLMWALLLVEEAVDPVFRQSSGRQRRVIEKPVLESLPSGSASEFRALLGTETPQSRLTEVEKKNAFVIKWSNQEAEYPILQIKDTKENINDFNLSAPVQLFQDPVTLFMVADLWMRNKASLDNVKASQFAETVATQANPQVYQRYACIYNTITNENWINASLVKRNRPRAVSREHRASEWYRRVVESNRVQQRTVVSPFCVGYLPSCVNLIFGPDRLVAAEPRFSRAGQPRTLLFVVFSALRPFVDSTGVVVVESELVSVIAGKVPSWFGLAHRDQLLSWLQMPNSTGFRVYDLAPLDFLSAVESVTAGEMTVHEAVSQGVLEQYIRRAEEKEPEPAGQTGQTRQRTEPRFESKFTSGKKAQQDFSWAVLPVLGQGIVAREHGDQSQSAGGSVAVSKAQYSSVKSFWSSLFS
jgi:hypothetical protein